MTPEERVQAAIRWWTTYQAGTLETMITTTIRAAIAEEREACAKLAELHCTPEEPYWQEGSCDDRIATAIRLRP